AVGATALCGVRQPLRGRTGGANVPGGADALRLRRPGSLGAGTQSRPATGRDGPGVLRPPRRGGAAARKRGAPPGTALLADRLRAGRGAGELGRGVAALLGGAATSHDSSAVGVK